ncbi:LysR family transcriptional regulator [Herbaspirillum sp. GCM10030257]|uniref:LysR family transcriptional regulator n=1 Tax=Herbaspirillum sp. GCM10030257 TaxID=3273393 RepID=UPI00360D867A
MTQTLRHLNLDLVRILYLLMTEHSVSMVALKMNRPQPTISASLRKLRDLFNDPLLVRGTHGLVPTSRGIELIEPSKRILDEMEKIFVQRSTFCPQTEQHHFHIAAPDYLDSRLLPTIATSLRRQAPKSEVSLHYLGSHRDYSRGLAEGTLDLVIANWDDPPQHLHIAKLFEDEIACFMRADCAYSLRTKPDAMTITDYLSLPHVVPSQMQPGYIGIVDELLEERGLYRNIVVNSAYFSLIPMLMVNSDLVLTTGRQYMKQFERSLPIKAFDMPLSLPSMKFSLLWHERAHQTPAHKWLRGLVSTVTKDLLKINGSS